MDLFHWLYGSVLALIVVGTLTVAALVVLHWLRAPSGN